METFSAALFNLVVSVASSFSGNCATHNDANLQAMSCQAGYTWDENTVECVPDAPA